MRLFIAIYIILLLCACKKTNNAPDEQPPGPTWLKSSVSSVTLGNTKDSKDSFTISSNINWEITIDPSAANWLSTNVSSGSNDAKIYVTALSNNNSQAGRTATITISAVGITTVHSVSINVSQDFLSIPPGMLWQKTFGGSNREYGNAIVATPDGNFLMAGYTESTNGDVTANKGSGDVWLVKFTNSGNIIWQKTLGGTGMDQAFSLINTSDGGYAFAGQTGSNNGDVSGSHGDPDVWVVKLDDAGNITWQKCLGGSNDEIGYSITQTTDGDLIIAGRTLSNDGDVVRSHGSADVFVARLNINGNVVWTKAIGGSNADVGWAVAATPDNGCVITGWTASDDGDITSSVHGNSDLLAVKLDNDGNILWQKAFGGSEGEQGNAILATGDGGYIIAGSTYSNDGDVSGNHGDLDGWILMMDAGGMLQTERTIGGTKHDYFNSINTDGKGNYMLAGVSDSKNGDVPSNNGDEDFWTVLLDANGNISKTRSFGGTGTDEAKAIVGTPDGNYMVTGNTGSNNGDVSGYHGGLNDAWVLKFEF
jgi:hypothetical protein